MLRSIVRGGDWAATSRAPHTEGYGEIAMAMATTLGTLPEAEHSAQLRRAVIASTVGTAIEWYDFFIYGTAAALVFPALYFPESDAFTGQIYSFGTFTAG